MFSHKRCCSPAPQSQSLLSWHRHGTAALPAVCLFPSAAWLGCLVCWTEFFSNQLCATLIQFQYSSISAPLPHNPVTKSESTGFPRTGNLPPSKHRPADTTSSAVRLLLPQSHYCALVVPTHYPAGSYYFFLLLLCVCPSNTDSIKIFYLPMLDFLLHPMFHEGYFIPPPYGMQEECLFDPWISKLYGTLNFGELWLPNPHVDQWTSIPINCTSSQHIVLGAILQWVLGTGRPYPRSL